MQNRYLILSFSIFLLLFIICLSIFSSAANPTSTNTVSANTAKTRIAFTPEYLGLNPKNYRLVDNGKGSITVEKLEGPFWPFTKWMPVSTLTPNQDGSGTYRYKSIPYGSDTPPAVYAQRMLPMDYESNPPDSQGKVVGGIVNVGGKDIFLPANQLPEGTRADLSWNPKTKLASRLTVGTDPITGMPVPKYTPYATTDATGVIRDQLNANGIPLPPLTQVAALIKGAQKDQTLATYNPKDKIPETQIASNNPPKEIPTEKPTNPPEITPKQTPKEQPKTLDDLWNAFLDWTQSSPAPATQEPKKPTIPTQADVDSAQKELDGKKSSLKDAQQDVIDAEKSYSNFMQDMADKRTKGESKTAEDNQRDKKLWDDILAAKQKEEEAKKQVKDSKNKLDDLSSKVPTPIESTPTPPTTSTTPAEKPSTPSAPPANPSTPTNQLSNAEIGKDCSLDKDCKSGYCDMTLFKCDTPPAPPASEKGYVKEGEDCTGNGVCESGYCNSEGVCAKKPTNVGVADTIKSDKSKVAGTGKVIFGYGR